MGTWFQHTRSFSCSVPEDQAQLFQLQSTECKHDVTSRIRGAKGSAAEACAIRVILPGPEHRVQRLDPKCKQYGGQTGHGAARWAVHTTDDQRASVARQAPDWQGGQTEPESTAGSTNPRGQHDLSPDLAWGSASVAGHDQKYQRAKRFSYEKSTSLQAGTLEPDHGGMGSSTGRSFAATR
eukprot:gene10659-12340_t